MAEAKEIVLLDVVESNRLRYSRCLVQVTKIIRQIGIVLDAPQVALEVCDIHGIEADECREQAPFDFGWRVTHQKPRTAKDATRFRRELQTDVSPRIRKPAGLVHTVVDTFVHESIDAIYFLAQGRRIIVDFHRSEGVELAVQHADNPAGFIVNDPP